MVQIDLGELKRLVAANAHDPQMLLISEALYKQWINDAVDDLRSNGWLVPLEEDETLEMVANDYIYTVPADFAYIKDIWEESLSTADLYDELVDKHTYRLGYEGSVAAIIFNSNYWAPTSGKKLKIVGQKRPPKYTSDSTTVEDGFVGFLRMRATAYAFLYLGSVPVEEGDVDQLERRIAIANTRIATAQVMMAESERRLARHPMEFRVRSGSKHVPTR